MKKPIFAGFIVNLLQDLNILRPLIYLVSDDLGLTPIIIVTSAFIKRDKYKAWMQQIKNIKSDVHAEIHIVSTSFEAWSLFNESSGGFLISASESDLNNHKETHEIFRIAPEKIKTLTLQHGFECVGFLMNQNHQKSHGHFVNFAADYICGWVPQYLQRNLSPHQRTRYLDLGPTAWIGRTSKRQLSNSEQNINRPSMGIVCENLHSARHTNQSNVNLFMEQFFEFADYLNTQGKQIALRPHPGGQYTVRNEINLPDNVVLVNQPSYNVDWGSFLFGITAPSSVLFDLIINNVPTIIWQDQQEMIDISQVSFLPIAKSTQDMIDFSTSSANSLEPTYNQQIDSILSNSHQVTHNYTHFLSSICDSAANSSYLSPTEIPGSAKIRVLLMAPALLPTLTISFLKPLSLIPHLIQYQLIHEIISKPLDQETNNQAIIRRCSEILDSFNPDIFLMCRQYGHAAVELAQLCRERGIKVIYHIDDLLYDPSPDVLDQDKYLAYKKRSPSIKTLIDLADLIYCSTPALGKELYKSTKHQNIYTGKVYKSVDLNVIEFQQKRKKIIGYTGFGHTQDLELIEDAIIFVLENNPDWYFELIGTIVPSKKLLSLGDRIKLIPPERDYESFIALLKSRKWSIGICPLIDNRFNSLKANTKWIEYSCCNIATIASNCEPYKYGTNKDSLLLCDSLQDWIASFELLMNSSVKINELVNSSQAEIKDVYSDSQLADQVHRLLKSIL